MSALLAQDEASRTLSPDQVTPDADPIEATRARLVGTPLPTDRLRGWLVTAFVGVLAAIVRFQNLGFPTDKGTPVFDEKHYVPQAWQMLRNGWFEDNPGYELTVHPPLGKVMIAIGEALFGYNGWGWRFTAALCGALMVVMVVRIARRLTRSTLLGGIAGILLIADGVSHIQSRMGMLDIFQAFFVLAAFACVLLDRDLVRQRLMRAVEAGWATESPYGPRLGVRWWRLAGGALLGLSCGVKWSGLYFMAAYFLLTIVFDLTARRAVGVRHPWWGTLLRDALPGLLAFLALPIVVYVACYAPWFASETGVYRHRVETGGTDAWSVVKGAVGSLFQWHEKVLDFHEHLVTRPESQHPWESKPWVWPMSLRPMLYYYEGGTTACGEAKCVSATMLIGTPALWWLSLPMLGWGLWRMFSRFDWRWAAVVTAYLAGYLPWFLNLDRQMYFFYATPMAAFLVLGITLGLGHVLGKATDGPERRRTGLLAVALYVGLVVANFAWLWPILNGDSITEWRWQAELWLPSWR